MAEAASGTEPVAIITSRCNHRDTGDDFFCLRFQVWYPSFDCAVRTRFRTCPGCFDCEQGRFNRKRHEESLRRVRFPRLAVR